jgi:hypothetical protein
VLAVPAGLAAVAAGYALYRLVLVVAETRLQEAAYTAGGRALIAAAVLLLTAALPRLTRTPFPRAWARRAPGVSSAGCAAASCC